MVLARFRLCVALLSVSLAGCETRKPEAAASSRASAGSAPIAESDPRPAPPTSNAKTFGAPINGGAELPLVEVLENPERFRDKPIVLEGYVRAACTRRGCWMELAENGDPARPGCRVTFKDYGFFVPTDSTGARAKVQGTVGVNTLPAERVAHLESEGGHFPRKNSDGSVDELRIVATGVELWRM